MKDIVIEAFEEELKSLCDFFKWAGVINLILEFWNTDIGTLKLYNYGGNKILKLATGGWGDNESIIGALSESMFWFMFWQESHRGGYYKFKIYPIKSGGKETI